MAEQNIKTAATANYGDDAIKTLSPREHLRLRPGMYVGTIGDVNSFENQIS